MHMNPIGIDPGHAYYAVKYGLMPFTFILMEKKMCKKIAWRIRLKLNVYWIAHSEMNTSEHYMVTLQSQKSNCNLYCIGMHCRSSKD